VSCFLVASLPSLGCVFGDLRWCWPVFCCMGLFIVGRVIGVAHSSFVCVSCMISTACLNVM
jgi:hypothetical protein